VENHCNNISAELCSVLPNDHKPVVDKLIQQDLRYFARKRKWLSKNESLLNTKNYFKVFAFTPQTWFRVAKYIFRIICFDIQ
jgi:hypothetical protein